MKYWPKNEICVCLTKKTMIGIVYNPFLFTYIKYEREIYPFMHHISEQYCYRFLYHNETTCNNANPIEYHKSSLYRGLTCINRI